MLTLLQNYVHKGPKPFSPEAISQETVKLSVSNMHLKKMKFMLIDHKVYQRYNTLSIKSSPRKLIRNIFYITTVYPKKYAHGFVVLCFVVVIQSFIMNSHGVFNHIHQDCFAGTGAIVWLPQCQWSKPDGYGKISQCITTTNHSKAVTVCLFLEIYCSNGVSNNANNRVKWSYEFNIN